MTEVNYNPNFFNKVRRRNLFIFKVDNSHSRLKRSSNREYKKSRKYFPVEVIVGFFSLLYRKIERRTLRFSSKQDESAGHIRGVYGNFGKAWPRNGCFIA